MSTESKIATGLFVLAAVTFGYFTGGAGWNQDAPFDLTRALVERHTRYIDGYELNTGCRYLTTMGTSENPSGSGK